MSNELFRLSYRECREALLLRLAERASVPAISWQEFLLEGPPR